jgi:tRNA dimethylallyltransferase
LEGDYSLDAAVHLAVVATRQYAKRQMTWLRSEGNLWRWIDPVEPNSVALVLNVFNESQQ